MKNNNQNKHTGLSLLMSVILVWVFLIMGIPTIRTAAAGTLSISGLDTSISGTDVWTLSENKIEGTAATTSQKNSCGGTDYYNQSGKITLTNNLGTDAQLTFELSVSNSSGSYSVGGSALTDGTHSVPLSAGGTYEIYIESPSNSEGSVSVTVTITGFAAKNTMNITFLPVEGITYTVNDETVTDTAVELTCETGDAITVACTATNYHLAYADWSSVSNGGRYYIGSDNSLIPTETCSVTPAFIYDESAEAPFVVGGYSLWTWETAIEAAQNSSSKTFILNKNYTLPGPDNADLLAKNMLSVDGGNYVTFAKTNDTIIGVSYHIPIGVTFHIPNDVEHTGLRNGEYPQVLTLTDAAFNTSDYPTPYAKGTLTVGANTTITSNGTLIISGKQVGATWQFTGSACGPYGLIKLTASTSKLHIQSGKTYCYGYITGDGTVEVDNGATLYELLQLRDWRGFSFGSSWMGLDVNTASYTDILGKIGDMLELSTNAATAQQTNRSFVFSQYYFQNVEADLIMNVGSALKTALTMNNKEGTPQVLVRFVSGKGEDGLLQLSGSGYVKREYDSTTDRITYAANCDITSGGIKMTFGVSMKDVINVDIPLDTTLNILAINSNMGFVIKSGKTLTIASDLKLLPDAYIDVETGGHLVIDGSELYVYDKADWTAGGYAYNYDLHQLHYVATKGGAPTTREINNSAKINVDGDMTITSDGYLFTTAGYVRHDGTAGDAGNADKVITGTGKIVNQSVRPDDLTNFGKLDEFEFRENNWTRAQIITTTPFVGKLAGITDGTTYKYNAFAADTYYGTENDGWYNYLVTAEYTDDSDEDGQGVGAADAVTVAAPTNCTLSPVHRYGETEPVTNVVGYLSKYWDPSTSANANSTFSFTIDPADAKSVTAQKIDGTAIDLTGEYELPFVESDVKLILERNRINIAGSSLKAGDTLDLYFYVAASDLTEGASYTARVQRTKQGEDVGTTEIPSSQWVKDGQYLRFAYDGIAAKEMTDEVHVTIHDASGNQISNVCTESVENYAVRALAIYANAAENSKNAALRTTLVDMLNYGAACQDFFDDYNIDAPANARIDPYQSFASIDPTMGNGYEGDGNYFAGGYVTVKSNLYFTFLFKPDVVTSQMTAYVTYLTHGGTEVSKKLPIATDNSYSSYNGVQITGLSIAGGRQDITCVIKDANGNEITTAKASIARYVSAAQKNNVCEDVYLKLMRFVDSAYAYFHYGEAVS